jgi:hypothetical protein
MGLTAKTPGRAFFRTVIFGFLAPHLICTPTLVNQLVVFLLAMDKVNVHFRRFVASQYLANTPSLAAVSPTPPNTPPVLRHGMP